jgi:hypothetical protein
VLQPVSLLADVPATVNLAAAVSNRPYGTNVGTMLNGYFVTTFAPDSGLGSGGFLVYDIADPRRPRLVRRVFEPFGSTNKLREAHSLPAAIVDGRQLLAVQAIDGVELWDFTDVRNPVQFSRLPLSGINQGDYFDAAWQLTWQGRYLYVAGSNHGVYIVDTSDPRRLQLADRGSGRRNPVPIGELGGFRIGPVFAFGNRLVASSMDNQEGFANLDLSDPLNPVVVRTSGPVENFYSSCFDGSHLFLSADDRVSAFSLDAPGGSSAGGIERLGSSFVPGPKYCARKDDLLISGNSDHITLHSTDDLNSLDEIGRASLGVTRPDHGQVTPLGNVVFVGNDHGTGSGFIPISTEPDRRPPAVHATAPFDGETGVGVSTSVGVSFSDTIALESVTPANVTLTPVGGSPVAVTFSSWLNTLTFTPDEPLLPDTTYVVRVAADGVRDVSGNPTSAGVFWTFSTGSTLATPIALTATPARSPIGSSVAFSTAPGGTGYEWDFGDGSPPVSTTSPMVEHILDSPGHRQVTVRRVDPDGVRFAATSTTTTRESPWSTPPRESSTVATSGGTAFAVNPESRTVAAVSVADGRKLWEVGVDGDPSTLSAADDGSVWVTVDDELVQVSASGAVIRRVGFGHGSAPYGVVSIPGQGAVAVTRQGDSRLDVVDTSTGAVRSSVQLSGDPRGLAVSGDGSSLWVTRFRPEPDPAAPQVAGPARVWRVPLDGLGLLGEPEALDLPVDTSTVDGEGQARGVANYLEQVVLNPDGSEAWVPSKKDNVVGGIFRDGAELTPETTVRSLVTRIAVEPDASVVDTIDVNDRSAGRAVVFTPAGDYAFVAHMETNEVTLVDAYSGQPVAALPDLPNTPAGMAIDADSGTLVVQHTVDRSVSRYDVSAVLDGTGVNALGVGSTDTVEIELLDAEERLGERVFHDASDPRMTSNRYLSCASCHQDGDADNQTWDFSQRGEGLRSTTPLAGRSGSGQNLLHWSANFDELQDFENDIRDHFGGRGFMNESAFAQSRLPLGAPKAGRSAELDALAAYVRGLSEPRRSPFRGDDGNLTPGAARGQAVFESQGCASCHSGPTTTDGQRHDVGTVDSSSGRVGGLFSTSIDTPSLGGLWATAPYFHNGSAGTLDAVLERGHGSVGPLSPTQRADLVEYLRSLEAG